MFLYVVLGNPKVGEAMISPYHLATFDHSGDMIAVTTDEPVTLLYGHADPIGEPVVAHGPFVMTTRDEIGEAIRDYQAGLFSPEPKI